MDDLLIIILTLLVALVGAFGRKKKRNAAQPLSTGTAKQPQDFWDMFTQEESRPQQTYPVEEYEEELPEEKVVIEKVVEKPKYQFKAEEEGKSDIREEMKKTLNPEQKKVKIDGEEFSLRKAVIYREILNRKYT